MTVALSIDGRQVEVEPGQTVLAAARKLGIDIPTLCHHPRCTPATSCLVCLVKVERNGSTKLVPSCATLAEDGLVVESETNEVHDARRTALELLFSDHVGDCLAPCNRLCPLDLNIPLMLRQIESKQIPQAIETVKQALPLPSVLGRLCHSPCENGCRRATWDQAAAIRDLERFVAEQDRQAAARHFPPRKRDSGKRVVVIGAGPTGLAAAQFLLREGHRVTLLDRHDQAGGSLRREIETGALPADLLADEVGQLVEYGAELRCGSSVNDRGALEGLRREFDAVLLATGASAKDEAESLGLDASPAGIRVAADSGQTSAPNLFAAGSAVKSVRHVVRALAEGKDIAQSINRFLRGENPRLPAKPFSSVMGRLEPNELRLFLRGPSEAPRTSPAFGLLHGFSPKEAQTEAGRCLHCDCRSVGNCALQRYAERYGADAGRFRQQRRTFEQDIQHGEIVFEPGKCILCGICVQLAEQAREPLGLAFVGRGFDVRLAVPWNRAIDDGLQRVGRDCVEACPTGALAFKD